MRHSGLPLAASGSRANNTPCQTPLCPKRRPPRPQQPIFTIFHRGGLHFERRTLRRPGSAQASTAIRVARSRNSIEYLRRPGIPNLQSGLRHSPQYPGQHPARRHCTQNADHLAHNSLFSAFFTEVVCTLSAAPPRTATSLPQNGGNDIIRAATRRRHAASQPLMLHPQRARLETNAGHTAPGWCPTAVPVGGGRTWPGFKTTPITHQHTRHRRCGGRRVSCGTREAWLWGLAAVPVVGGAWMGCAQQ